MILFQKFLFLYKSKYRRKAKAKGHRGRGLIPMPHLPSLSPSLCATLAYILFTTTLLLETAPVEGVEVECVLANSTITTTTPTSNTNTNTGNSPPQILKCVNGDCIGNRCVCRSGWTGAQCQHCYGKVKVIGNEGWISDGIGNYTANMKCTWLIESSPSPDNTKNKNDSNSLSPIFLRIEEFATECGWDHLYVYDGDNVHSPLLGVFSGILVEKNYQALRLPEIVAKSGYALLHFYTDVAYNLTGFNITYRSNSCPSNSSSLECSGNGVCLEASCTCNALYTGDACNVEKCPNNCTSTAHGTCDMEKHRCSCNQGYFGNDCSHKEKEGFWEVVRLDPGSKSPVGAASHAAVVHNNSMWVFGGNPLRGEDSISIARFDFKANTWETVQAKGDIFPQSVYGHSCVVYEGKVFLYGGVHDGKFGTRDVSRLVWAFDLTSRKWSKINIKAEKCKRGLRSMCGPLHLVGHTAVVINEKGNKSRHSRMVVISGYDPRYGYVNVVQEFHFGSSNWNIQPTKPGFHFSGSYGHSSHWDPVTQKIYVFGGYQIAQDSTSAHLSNSLYSYDPSSHSWHQLEGGPQGRFLHSAAIFKGLYFIFGGNGHNDTTYSLGSKCFTSEVLVYDILCGSWTTLKPPPKGVMALTDIHRYGHSVVAYQNSMFIYGGFNGVVQNDVVRFSPPLCAAFSEGQEQCGGGVGRGAKCVWNKGLEQCEAVGSKNYNYNYKDKDKERDKEKDKEREKDALALEKICGGRQKKIEETCQSFSNCLNCLQNKYECVWCGGQCQYRNCRDVRHKPISNTEQCKEDESVCKYHLHNCPLCTSEINCIWSKDERCTKDSLFRNPTEGSTTVVDRETTTCEQSCADYSSCTNCTSNNCMWCNNLNTCVDKNAYVISFPYGQCMSWSQIPASCLSKTASFLSSTASLCDEVPSCDTCLALPSCGWCDDGSGTGKGGCMDGSGRGPLVVNATGSFLNKTMCQPSRWHFTNCPDCQCNGHSTCDDSNRCRTCDDFTEGDHCERCIQGYYGHAINGGQCKPCECNNQAEVCHTETGRCFCTTKGITGEDCKKCDTQNNYSGDPNNSSCFYELQIDYQFTFNLSKKEDQYFTKINFRNTPNKQDIDADFMITCSMMAKMNISYVKVGHPETFIIKGHNCSSFRYRFSRAEFSFGAPDNTTFYVYVYDFRPPLWIQISFSQSPKLDLLHFFITFSSCFLVLLVLAAVMWKIKQKYDMFRRRQRLFVEMEQMASRPFAQVYLEVGRSNVLTRLSSLRKRRKDSPSPIALEPCQGNRAAVLSLLITLPTGSTQFAPPGQSGLSVGSTLVALGNPRKVSFEPVSKTEGKNSKIRKSLPSHSLNTCI